MELFEQRAESLSEGESTAVEEICRRLDGIPSAIESAASRMASMAAAEVRIVSMTGSGCWSGSRRGLVATRRALRQAVRASYDLLSDDETHFLSVLGVPGGFDLQSACAIA